MKKQLLTILAAIFIAGPIFAQMPIITSTNQIPSIGDSISYINANSFGFDPMPAGGANVDWDYSALVNETNVSFMFQDYATAPENAHFPTANAAMANTDPSATGHEWFETSATEIKRLGYTDPTLGNIYYENGGFVRYQFPFEPGNNWQTPSYTASTTIDLSGDSTRIENGSYYADVDAYGTLTLPTGVTDSVVRVHVIEQFDFIAYVSGIAIPGGTVTDDYYFWFSDNHQEPILIYGTTTSSAGGAPDKALRYQPVGVATAINEQNTNVDFNIYPNPNNGIFTIVGDNSSAVVNVYNITGENVYQENISSLSNNEINISNLNKGVYFVKLSNANNTITKKVVIK